MVRTPRFQPDTRFDLKPSINKKKSKPRPIIRQDSEELEEFCELEKNEEDPADYANKGYGFVELGETLNGYTIIRKLGWGNFSTVWLGYDFPKHKFVAIKIARSKDNYLDYAKIEQDILNDIKLKLPSHPGYRNIIHSLDTFEYHINSQEHYCTVFDAFGSTLLSKTISSETGIELPGVQKIAKQMLLGLQYLHDVCDLIHTDIKPENVLVTISKEKMYALTKQVMDKRYKGRGFGCNIDKKKKLTNSQIKKLDKVYSKIWSYSEETNPVFIAESGQSFIGSIDEADEINDWELETLPGDSMLTGEVISLPLKNHQSRNGCPKRRDFSKNRFCSPGPRAKVLQEILDPAVTIKLIDIGNAYYKNEVGPHIVSTLEYRAPEVTVKMKTSSACDIWSTACTLFELITDDFLFISEPKEGKCRNRILLQKIFETLGLVDGRIYSSGTDYKTYFDDDGEFKFPLHPDDDIAERLIEYGYESDEIVELLDFFKGMFDYDPAKRATASQCLEHPWIKKEYF